MKKILLLSALFMFLAILGSKAAIADNSASVDAYGSLSASYYQGVTESWITEKGTTTTTTYAISGTINGIGGQNGVGVVNGDITKTPIGTSVTTSYEIELHGISMRSGSKLEAAAGVSSSTSGPAASASGKVELSQSVQGYQRVEYTGFPPGSYGVQSYSASQSTQVTSK
jgi:hypothetical protein